MPRVLRENGLSLAMAALFLVFLAGESLAGHLRSNQDRREHGQPALAYVDYVVSSEFVEATLENWESEFLEMAGYVLLTAFLFQKGSAESKKLDEAADVDRDPRGAARPDAPWPVRRGGLALTVYENSLSLAFFLLFLTAFTLHMSAGARAYSREQIAHGGVSVSALGYLGTSSFWFQSLQNWQSEFLGIGAMVVLSIFLRQRGSPESKPVDAPHHETGGS